MASREIKNLLKAAKAALDRQEFDTANLRCQVGLVVCGVANRKAVCIILGFHLL